MILSLKKGKTREANFVFYFLLLLETWWGGDWTDDEKRSIIQRQRQAPLNRLLGNFRWPGSRVQCLHVILERRRFERVHSLLASVEHQPCRGQ